METEIATEQNNEQLTISQPSTSVGGRGPKRSCPVKSGARDRKGIEKSGDWTLLGHGRGVAMKTFCVLCRNPIPPNRRRRGARTCSPECQREYRRQYRLERNSRICRACGRPLRRKRDSGQRNSVPEPFQTAKLREFGALATGHVGDLTLIEDS
jgi:hypothetical protein